MRVSPQRPNALSSSLAKVKLGARRSSTSPIFAAQPFDQKLIRYSFVSLAARHQSLIGPPSHAARFCDIIANPGVRVQTAPKLKCLSQRPIPPALALGAVAEPIRPPACERDRAVGKMELCGELPSSRAHPPPAVATEGLLCRCEFEPIVGFALLSTRPRVSPSSASNPIEATVFPVAELLQTIDPRRLPPGAKDPSRMIL
jgi:hypothetical protein